MIVLLFRFFGSSPRMWGTLKTASICLKSLRFIPTHVGNSPAFLPVSGTTAVHPHACGELRSGSEILRRHPGSSPRMWGTQGAHVPGIESCRFIPTHVGNSASGMNILIPIPVHPHACGELFRPEITVITRRGSSPRMWGTLFNYYIRTRKITSYWIRFFHLLLREFS